MVAASTILPWSMAAIALDDGEPGEIVGEIRRVARPRVAGHASPGAKPTPHARRQSASCNGTFALPCGDFGHGGRLISAASLRGEFKESPHD
jgi:hypothetical protein